MNNLTLKLLVTSDIYDNGVSHFEAFTERMKSENVRILHITEAGRITDAASDDLDMNGVSKSSEFTSDCQLMITSSEHYVNLAKKLGITCIQYLGGNRLFDISSYAADVILESFEELDYGFLVNTYLHSHQLPVIIGTTDRLVIRELCPSDTDALYNMYIGNNSTPFGVVTASSHERHELIKSYINLQYKLYGFGYWGVFLAENNELIGHCGFEIKTIDNQEYHELGYMISHEHHRNGYATEAVKHIIEYASGHLSIDVLTAVIPVCNIASIKVAEKCGLIKYGKILRNQKACYLYQTN